MSVAYIYLFINIISLTCIDTASFTSVVMCVDDSVWGAGVLMFVVLLLKMMNRVFQFRTMEPTHISILSPRRSETSMSIPQ